MRRLVSSLSAAALGLAVAAAAMPAQAADTDQKSNVALAAKGGWWDADVSGFSGSPAFGLEMSADDTIMAVPAGKIRHMASWNRADGDGLEINTAEWNAHWMFQAPSGLWIGAGPGLGWVWTEGKDNSDGIGVQFGASAHYIQGHALFGIESRWQWTEADSADNWLTMAKVGWVF